ncbi:MAG: hypothetical protein JWQ35_1248, partial [Bacteriovoracaceae bacterium]|nr:hypothetical protein [Bacteriovoracaceae bacterium]
MRLRCTSGSLSGEVYELDSRYPYLFGRETSETDSELIVLPSPTVSRKHCKIIFENGSAIIEDLNSANGIRVNRKRINRATLKNKDLLQIGAFSFTVEDQQVETSDKSEPQTGKKAAFKIDNPKLAPYVKKLNVYWAQFERLDLKYRALILL